MPTLIDLVATKAADEVWQRPAQDRVARFTGKPITANHGAKRCVRSGHNMYHLPDSKNSYIVYDLGQLNPHLYGFDVFMNDWFSVEAICNNEEMFVQLLINNRRLPMKYSYMMRSESRSTLIAIRRDKAFDLFKDFEDISASFYSNKWYNSVPGNLTTGLEVKSYDVDDNMTLTNFFNELIAARARPSNVMVFVNGLYKDINAASDINLGDYVDLIEDMSGVGYYDINLQNAPHFLSTLDKKMKYLLLAPDTASNETVNFKDDINIVIYNEVPDSIGGKMKQGVIYDLYSYADIRMVTHRDHSIDSVRVKNILLSQGEDLTQGNTFARVFIRNADINKILPSDGNYLKDMYLFNRDDRRRFMTGTHSVIDEWKAANLEESPYTRWLGMPRHELGFDTLKDVFSSHGLYEIIEKPTKNGATYNLPPIAYLGGMALLYNANYELTSIQTITPSQGASGSYSLPAGIEYLEFIPGNLVASGKDLEVTSLYIDPQGSFAEELFVKDGTNTWLSAIEGTHYDIDLDNKVYRWKAAYATLPKMKRDSGKFHMNTRTMNRGDLIELFDIFTGDIPALNFETGRVDVWLNKKRLIRNLDYQVEWPRVRIHNVEYIQDSNEVIVLAHGLPKHKEEVEFDFIKYGHLNYDEKFRLTFNRPKEIIIDGLYGNYPDISFSERRLNTKAPEYREGAPYSVQTPMYHVPSIYHSVLTNSRKEDVETTEKIENYITLLEKENIVDVVSTIPHKHEIMSYTICKLINDLNAGNVRIVNDSFSRAGVASVMAKYRNVLANDPTYTEDWDWSYILVAAHNANGSVGISSLHYSFLSKVVEYYFDNRCQLNNYLHVI